MEVICLRDAGLRGVGCHLPQAQTSFLFRFWKNQDVAECRFYFSWIRYIEGVALSSGISQHYMLSQGAQN